LVRERRDADRKAKKSRSSHVTAADPQLLSEQADREDSAQLTVEQEGPERLLASTACPKCQSKLRYSEGVDLSDRSRARVRLYCPGCDDVSVYRVDLDQLASLYSAQ
jgi:hypothetical protein